MVELFTALALAGNVVQFVQFGCNLVAETHELYKSADGTSKTNLQTESITIRLIETIEELEDGRERMILGTKTSTERRLVEIAEACTMVAKDILNRLEKLKSRESPSVWSCVAKAFKAAWSKEELNALTRRLKAYVSELDTTILISMKYGCNSLSLFA